MTAATVDTDATVLDGLDFAHTPPCEAPFCQPAPAPAAWTVRFHVCCPMGRPPRVLLCEEHIDSVFRLLGVVLPVMCRVCGHEMPISDWVVSVHRLDDGGEQR